jgi:UDP-N-acetyl-D-mannosaminuronic acid dehydrogenase
MDAVTLAIQTPFKDNISLEPDFKSAGRRAQPGGQIFEKGMLIVLESTITPGTTRGLAVNILNEESGLIAGEDFALAHA